MKLLPRLIKTTMLLNFGHTVKDTGYKVSDGMKEVDVELWDTVGLCIHEYRDELKDKWRVSHESSGLSILRHIKSRQEAIYYMMQIYDWRSAEGLKVDWTMSEEKLRGVHYHEEIRGMLLGLQQEISGIRR